MMLEYRDDNLFKGNRIYAQTAHDALQGDFYVSVTSALDVFVDYAHKQFLLQSTPDTYGAIMKRTADMGTLLHGMFEAHLLGKPVDITQETEKPFQNFLELAEKHKLRASGTEMQVVSKTYGYCGTLDFFGLMDGELTIIDFKSGNSKISHGWQCGAYLYAYNEMTGNSVNKMAVVQVHRNGRDKKVLKYVHNDSCFEAFLSCLNVFRMGYFNELKKLQWKYLLQNPLQTYYKQLYKGEI